MVRRSLTAIVFLLLVWAQTLAAACDVRCSLPSHCGTAAAAAPAAMEHCGAMSHGDQRAQGVSLDALRGRCSIGHQADAVWPPAQPERTDVLPTAASVGIDPGVTLHARSLTYGRGAAFALPPPWVFSEDPHASSNLNPRV